MSLVFLSKKGLGTLLGLDKWGWADYNIFVNLLELNYDYPDHLVATKPQNPCRNLLVSGNELKEISFAEIIELFSPGDLLVINDTKVLKRRVFSKTGFEILFLENLEEGRRWQVLFPASRLKKNQTLELPDGVIMSLVERGLPQTIELSRPIDEKYFFEYGEMALPPYIQKARGERNNQEEDERWYQTAWAKEAGSYAAPTASLHFSKNDLQQIKNRGVQIVEVTLHVGLGTFLPIKVEDVKDHKMHKERIVISKKTQNLIEATKQSGGKIFTLGTTATRAIESWGAGLLSYTADGSVSGDSDLFIYPGFEFKYTDVLMTNFHQPGTTLMALVCGFSSVDIVKSAYKYAVENEFRLFSYGDFSIWKK